MNPLEFFNTIKSFKNPQQAIFNIIGNTNNPMMDNAIRMAKNNDVNGVENLARNLCKEKGIDFDKEFNEFMKNFK